MADHRDPLETTGWQDVSLNPRPARTAPEPAAPSRRWYHVRWVAFIIVLIAAAGYILSSYLAAKAGQSDWTWETMFAAPHAVAAMKRQAEGVRAPNAQPAAPTRPSGNANTIKNAAPARVTPEPAKPVTASHGHHAAAALGLTCIAGVAYRVEKRAGVTSYTNDPGVRCTDQ